MLNENVVKVLKNNTWTVATCAAGVPNAVPVGFKDVTEDGKLVVGDVFLETTMRNVLDNGKIAVVVGIVVVAVIACVNTFRKESK